MSLQFPITLLSRSAVVLVGALALVTAPQLSPVARACGGFFCNNNSPVNQTAEQIIFVDHGDGSVTAVIQIQYQGPASSFAWLLPVPGTPEISVSSNIAFQNLKRATDPQYILEIEYEGECAEELFFLDGAEAEFGGAAPPSAASEPAVTVLDEGSVGPYDYVVISVDSSLAQPADAAVDWLTANGYDVTAIGPEVLGPYLADGLNLVAFKLQKGNMVGAIRPVQITYNSELPMIPIRPTAVAAQNDMGILVYVVSGEQAIPKNYKSLVLNEALINWFNWRSTYNELVTAAANEAEGQGFVTELASPSRDWDEAIYSAANQQQWISYMNQSFVDGFDMIQQASWQYRSWDGWREAIDASVTLPVGVSLDDFGRNPNSYRDTVVIDENVFIQELFENVVKPVMDTQELLGSRPYLTRLFSTMSADEMTLDPLFDFNGDLADVSNIHMAKQIVTCQPGQFPYEANWLIQLPQGGILTGEGSGSWPLQIGGDIPANLKIVQLSTSGPGVVVTDNTNMVNAALFSQSGMEAMDPVEPVNPNGVVIGGDDPTGGATGTGTGGIDEVPGGDSGGGGNSSSMCSVSDVGSADGNGPTGLMLLALALGLVRRRGRES